MPSRKTCRYRAGSCRFLRATPAPWFRRCVPKRMCFTSTGPQPAMGAVGTTRLPEPRPANSRRGGAPLWPSPERFSPVKERCLGSSPPSPSGGSTHRCRATRQAPPTCRSSPLLASTSVYRRTSRHRCQRATPGLTRCYESGSMASTATVTPATSQPYRARRCCRGISVSGRFRRGHCSTRSEPVPQDELGSYASWPGETGMHTCWSRIQR